MSAFLSREGFEAEHFGNGEDAAFAVSGGDVSMVICGLSLGDMEGKTFIEKVREYFYGPVIIISASVDREDEETLHDLGVTAALEKTGKWKDALKPYLAALK
jgi:DNA-binding response OmpR family regulator